MLSEIPEWLQEFRENLVDDCACDMINVMEEVALNNHIVCSVGLLPE